MIKHENTLQFSFSVVYVFMEYKLKKELKERNSRAVLLDKNIKKKDLLIDT